MSYINYNIYGVHNVHAYTYIPEPNRYTSQQSY